MTFKQTDQNVWPVEWSGKCSSEWQQAWLGVSVKENRTMMWTRRTGGTWGREEIACHVISFAAQPWNTTPIRVSDDSTGSFAGTNNDPALCPGLLAWLATDI